MEPFGCSNVSPVFLIRNVEFTEISVIGQTQEHLRLKVAQNGASVNALFWNGAKYQDIMHYKNKFDKALRDSTREEFNIKNTIVIYGFKL